MDGLSANEVKIRISQGLSNAYKVDSSKSIALIVKDNVFTLFNLINFVIAFLLGLVGSYANMLYIVFIINNIVSGIVVEIRAKSIVDKLTILNREQVTAIRDGTIDKVYPEEIVIDDILQLEAGDQIPSDSIIRQGVVEVNESLLTGESDLIVKKTDDELLSGSYITSGQCLAKVKRVGRDNYSAKLAIEAKTHKPIQSELLSSINTVTKFTSRVVIPLGIILFIEAFIVRQDSVQSSVVSTSSALLGMLPKGMMVLIIIALITALIKLGQRHVLVQEMYSIETMAHVDTLCLDKTGTITDGKMTVKQLENLSDQYDEDAIRQIMGSFMKNSTDNSATMKAIRRNFDENDYYVAQKNIAFSSERKWSSMYFDGVGTVILGAPEKMFITLPDKIVAAQQKGRRVLALGVLEKTDIPDQTALTGVRPIAAIELEDSIRKDAKKTLSYLKNQGIDLRIISGDNPLTVSKVAERAGFADFQNYLDISKLSDNELKKKVMSTAIFGRVSPQQKKLIIQELKKAGRTVAMTGDGVNDILALREADLSIAMAEGDRATKQISNIVLLESDFSQLPSVLFEGRRVVNNMYRAAGIFFIKTIYSFLLSILCVFSALTGSVVVFPFIAIQITLIDQIIEGYPTFFLSFEADKGKISSKFLRSSLLKALPNSLLIIASVVFIHFYGLANSWSQLDMTTLMYYMLGSISLMGVIRACWPLDKLRLFLLVTTIGGFFVATILFRSILNIGLLTPVTAKVFVILLIISIITHVAIVICSKKLVTKKSVPALI
jgi:cation-transporting ATPase E